MIFLHSLVFLCVICVFVLQTDLLDPGKVPVPYPSPEKRSDCWDDWHVKMPCSEQNLFPADRTVRETHTAVEEGRVTVISFIT